MSDKTERSIAARDPFFDVELWRPWRSAAHELMRDWPQRFGDWPQTGALQAPAVDITETDDKYCVRAELPGVDKGDVTVELEDGVLQIRGEKKSRRDEKTEKGRRLECAYGAFSRGFSLPKDADADRITAEFKDGVLSISIAKHPESKPKQISVKG